MRRISALRVYREDGVGLRPRYGGGERREDVRFRERTVFAPCRKGKTTVGLFVSSTDNQTANGESLPCVRTFVGKTAFSTASRSFWWNWTSRRIPAYSANCAPSDATKRNGTPKWTRSLFGASRRLFKKFDREKVEFSGGNLIREFV